MPRHPESGALPNLPYADKDPERTAVELTYGTYLKAGDAD
jgi:hypothetical protein